MFKYQLISTLLALAYADETTTPTPGTESTPKSFTQEDVNKFLAEDRRKHEDTKTKLTNELKALQGRSNLTAEELASLNSRLEDVNNKYMTETELLKSENSKLKKSLDEDIKKIASEKEHYQNRFTKSTIHRSITDAASVEGAYNSKQVIALLESDSRLVDIVGEDGKPTGDVEVMVKLRTRDDKGKPVTLDLQVEKAVKRLKEDEAYHNLFKGTGTGGIGSHNRSGSDGVIDAKKLAVDPEAYRKARKEGKI